MSKRGWARLASVLVTFLGVSAAAGAARAQEQGQEEPPEEPTPPEGEGFPYGPPPIPPHVEESATSGPGGGYCYVGGHPVDTRSAAGPAWDNTIGVHTHFYPPVDLRLFALRDGCYTFVGDPSDFGYQGEVTSYYGAHPMLDNYGGGWCFMIGGHSHAFRPWSPSFVVAGPWYYWRGDYDATFWSYWPYYSYYYRSYYPRYYAGGRFYRRDGGYQVAPRIDHIPPASYAGGYRGTPRLPGYGRPSAWRGGPSGGSPNGWRGSPSAGTSNPTPSPGGWRGSPPAPAPSPAPAPAYRPPASSVQVPGGAWRGSAPSRTPSAPSRTPSAPSRTPSPPPQVHQQPHISPNWSSRPSAAPPSHPAGTQSGTRFRR